jgi:AraC family transcriptional regulator
MEINLVQLDKRIHRPAFIVAGYGTDFDATNHGRIPEMWGCLMKAMPLPGQVDRRAYGLCWGDGRKAMGTHYLAGVEVSSKANLPQDAETVDVPEQEYVVFRQTLDGGDIPPQMQASGREIWGVRVPKLGMKLAPGPFFELYPENFKPRTQGIFVDTYVPVVA